MWLIVLTFLAIVALLIYLDTIKPKKYPPGPNWLPIFGSALEVARLRKEKGALTYAIETLYNRYGPIIGLKIGQEKIVVCYGGYEIKEFLMNDSLNGRPRGPFYELRTMGRKGIMLTDEDFWVEQRRFILRHLRDFGFGKRNMSELIESEAETMVGYVKQQMGKADEVTLRMDSMFGIHVLNTLWTMLAGIKYNPDDKELRYLQTMLAKLLGSIDMIGTLFSHFPLLRYFAPEFSGYNLYMETHRNIWRFLQAEIKNHKETYDPDYLRDIIDVYLKILSVEDRPASFTEDQLLAVCLDFFVAGSETTTKSMAGCFLFLLLNPDVQRKAQEEIDRVVGKERIPSLNDRPNMPYTEALVMEVLRHFMGRTALGVPHRALKDTTLCGYFIPKDTMIVPSFRGLLVGDECPWPDRETFRPERFLENGLVKVPADFMPFGIGKRRCLGETLAKGNLFIFIAAMLQHFDFRLPDGHDRPPTLAVDGITSGTVPYYGVISLRN